MNAEVIKILEEGIRNDEIKLKIDENILKKDIKTCKFLRKELEQRKENLDTLKKKYFVDMGKEA